MVHAFDARQGGKKLLVALIVGIQCVAYAQSDSSPIPSTSASSNASAETAWAEVQKALRPPDFPAEWRTNRPSPEVLAQFQKKQGELAAQAAAKVRAFLSQYPDSPNAGKVKSKEREMLTTAYRFGNTNVMARLLELEEAQLKDPSLPEDERFNLKAQALDRAVRAKMAVNRTQALQDYEEGIRQLMKEYPSRREVYQMLLGLASKSSAEKSRTLAEEIVAGKAPEEIKRQAQAVLKRMDMVGKKPAIKFTALDGREVDMEKLKGKVVLLDFWATWCGPCVAELPNVKEVYDKFHSKGFEIVGISLDKDKDALTQFVAREKMAWPQYFDGKGWENTYGQEFGINSIPAMWLVDKSGQIRDLNGREQLAYKVEQMLAEPAPANPAK